MVARKESESQRATVQKKSDREVVVTRTFDAPVHLVFAAWCRPELFKKWWVPRSMGMTLRSCELDAAGTGAQEALHETFGQLDELLAELSAR